MGSTGKKMEVSLPSFTIDNPHHDYIDQSKSKWFLVATMMQNICSEFSMRLHLKVKNFLWRYGTILRVYTQVMTISELLVGHASSHRQQEDKSKNSN